MAALLGLCEAGSRTACTSSWAEGIGLIRRRDEVEGRIAKLSHLLVTEIDESMRVKKVFV